MTFEQFLLKFLFSTVIILFFIALALFLSVELWRRLHDHE